MDPAVGAVDEGAAVEVADDAAALDDDCASEALPVVAALPLSLAAAPLVVVEEFACSFEAGVSAAAAFGDDGADICSD